MMFYDVIFLYFFIFQNLPNLKLLDISRNTFFTPEARDRLLEAICAHLDLEKLIVTGNGMTSNTLTHR